MSHPLSILEEQTQVFGGRCQTKEDVQFCHRLVGHVHTRIKLIYCRRECPDLPNTG